MSRHDNQRGRERTPRRPGGRKRSDGGHSAAERSGGQGRGDAPDPPAEPTVAELLARSESLRKTALSVTRRMEELAAQIEAAARRASARQ